MLKLIHKIIYDIDEDLEMKSDPIREELWINNTIVLSGDWYHDHISDKIEGFIKGIRFFNECEVEKVKECGEI